MLQVEAKRQRSHRIQFIPFIILLLGILVIIIAVAWYKTALAKIEGNEMSQVNKVGVYIKSKLPANLKIVEFFSEFNNLEFRNVEDSELVILGGDYKVWNDLNYKIILNRFTNEKVLETEYFVPVAKFGTTVQHNFSIADLNTVIIQTEIFPYLTFDSKPELQNCDEIKRIVNNEDKIGIINLDCLDTSVAVLPVEGISIFGVNSEGYLLNREDEYLDQYILKYEVTAFYNDRNVIAEPLDYILSFFPRSPLAKSQLGQITMSGVTAMGRTVLDKIREFGPEYPAQKVANVTKAADIAHTSNEVSFLEDCTQESHTLSFCALPESLNTLTELGIDVVELTGNHNNDKGADANLYSLELYEAAGITYVGGGKDIADAQTIRYLDLNGNTVAFIGYNYAGPSYALATEDRAGAAYYSEDLMIEKIAEAKRNADIIIVVIQWANENNSAPDYIQQESAKLAIDSGADIVVGSQGHGTQKMEFYKDGVIFYALGNFIFDQMFSSKVREGVILRINTIDEKVMNLELLPYEIENFAQPNFVYEAHANEVINGIIGK